MHTNYKNHDWLFVIFYFLVLNIFIPWFFTVPSRKDRPTKNFMPGNASSIDLFFLLQKVSYCVEITSALALVYFTGAGGTSHMWLQMLHWNKCSDHNTNCPNHPNSYLDHQSGKKLTFLYYLSPFQPLHFSSLLPCCNPLGNPHPIDHSLMP